ncbi:hypothetical protein EB796_015474 [Bugula neritina]|uniref:Uncharacterized protein n=1 Tax=Bugula neritina TaxID=10212 RepID=A0A7J7JIT1_BUGNE|nr:hypothetical protein EB796_015474 [Bugula neritina]
MTKQIEELQRETGKLPQLIEDNKELTRQIGSKQEERDLDAARKDVMESSMSSHNSEDVAADDTTKLKEVEERPTTSSQVDKLKTELQATSKNKVEDMQRLANNYQHLQQDFDRLQDDLDAEKGQVSSLQEQLEAERSVVAQLKVKINSLVEEKDNITQTNHQLQSKVKNYESQMSEWKTKILALESDLDSKHGEATAK